MINIPQFDAILVGLCRFARRILDRNASSADILISVPRCASVLPTVPTDGVPMYRSSRSIISEYKVVTRIYFLGCLGDETARPVGPKPVGPKPEARRAEAVVGFLGRGGPSPPTS